VPAALVKAPAAITGTANPVQDTSKEALVKALVAQQTAIKSLEFVATATPVTVLEQTPVVSGEFKTISADPDVVAVGANLGLTATKSVLTKLAADTTKQDLVVFAKKKWLFLPISM